jgi:XTP/dITP diphosphohydrolase
VPLVIATTNPGKVRELSALLPEEVELLSLDDVGLHPAEETGTSFVENALIKARHAATSGYPALADDSGLEVDALAGAPGIYSARYAGPVANDTENNAKLLHNIEGVDDALRTARFRAAAALIVPGVGEFTASGVIEGRIRRQPKGRHGFGYDPLLQIEDPDAVPYRGRTMAELEIEEKNEISHRSRAVRALLELVRARGYAITEAGVVRIEAHDAMTPK